MTDDNENIRPVKDDFDPIAEKRDDMRFEGLEEEK